MNLWFLSLGRNGQVQGGFNFPVEIRFLIQALSGLIIVAIIKFVCNGFGWKYHDSYAKMASNYLDSTVNYFTEKPEVEVDPVTKTVNPSSRGRGVMGDIQNLMSMANSLPGVSKLGDCYELSYQGAEGSQGPSWEEDWGQVRSEEVNWIIASNYIKKPMSTVKMCRFAGCEYPSARERLSVWPYGPKYIQL